MRNRLRLACLLALALPASVAVAADPAPQTSPAPLLDAYFGLGAGYGWLAYDGSGVPGGSADNNGVSVRGRASFAAVTPGGLGWQADGVLQYDAAAFDVGPVSFDDPTTTATLASHLFWRDPNAGLIGVIGQYSDQRTQFDAGAATFSLHDKNYYAGVEGQYFLDSVTLYGQVAYRAKRLALGVGTSAVDGNGIILAAQARYFVTPDWSFAVKGTFDTIRYDATTTRETVWQAGLRSEYRLATLPVSLYGEVSYGQGHSEDSTGFFEIDEKDTRAMVGVQYSLGARTLLERDRAGASLDPFETHLTMP